jgi:glucose dehydrogenase
MSKHILTIAAVSAVALTSGAASANSDVKRLTSNPNNWAIWGGNYEGQINTGNVGDLQVAWTFSTGVLRGHEGGPLVVGDMMYIHTPFPNKVFALDLAIMTARSSGNTSRSRIRQVIPVMCCDTVNRGPAYARRQDLPASGRHHVVALDAKTGQVLWSVQRRPEARARPTPPPCCR